ncbi:MAG TPA: AI-2E family transporter [Gemmatimonadaceae bacterium]
MGGNAKGEGRDAPRPWYRGASWRASLPIAMGIALGAGLIILVWLMARALALLVVAIAVAEGLEPIVQWLHRRNVSRNLAVVLVYFALGIVVAAVGWLIAPALAGQMQELSRRAPELLDRAQAGLAHWDEITGGRLAGAITSAAGGLAGNAIRLPMLVLGALVDMALVVFLSIYWLVVAPALKRFTLSLIPSARRARADGIMKEMGEAMGGYVRGVAINAVIMGALAWLGLWAIGIEYAVVLGVLTMLGEPIPYIGPIAVAIPVVGVALLQSTTKAILALALFTVLQQFEGHILTPNIMESQTDVPQALVIFAIAAGAALGGLLGVLAALPLAAAIRVFVLRVVAPTEREMVGAE